MTNPRQQVVTLPSNKPEIAKLRKLMEKAQRTRDLLRETGRFSEAVKADLIAMKIELQIRRKS